MKPEDIEYDVYYTPKDKTSFHGSPLRIFEKCDDLGLHCIQYAHVHTFLPQFMTLSKFAESVEEKL